MSTNIRRKFLSCPICLGIVVGCFFAGSFSPAFAKERLIDTIIATVDEIPITLVELGTRIYPPRQITIEQLKTEESLQKALDALILEKLLIAEAERKNIKVLDDDIERYIEEVKKKNNLDDKQFQEALRGEGQTMAAYKDRIRTEILKSRVASASIKNTTAVTDDEVNAFIRNRIGGVTSTGRKVHLRKVSLLKSDYSSTEAASVASELFTNNQSSNLVNDLGFVTENELSEPIKAVIRSVTDGSVSEPLESDGFWTFFQVIERQDSDKHTEEEESLPEVDESIRAQIKQKLEQDKLQKKMEQFLDQELPTLHTVDKKI